MAEPRTRRPKERKQQTAFGISVDIFCAVNGMTKKELADRVGINYNTLCEVKTGGTPGYDIVEKVNSFMDGYKREAP